ncbi:hypothetical protein KBY70_14070 [Cyanobium sp. ATX 6E8]|uniref:hypothetical protein n=1 Tax=Cyanobium sp. ATX 6E8 TaxID=2823701 RepID=UPI0020CDE4C2|nr:hypothetical protein [Cyanobium sp. ATX 6E8]MCP9943506.1 hypothetical protein [Cyanobium sp. ATX 6E8]
MPLTAAGLMRPPMLVALVLAVSAAGLWLAWPWLAPLWFSVSAAPDRPDRLVVLDGTPSRLAQAERLAAALPPQRLLIRCPRSTPPPQPLPELLQGFDTTTQITALADWLRVQPVPSPRRVWIATDPDHTARAVLLARLALGGRGLAVAPAPPPPPSTLERRKLLRDALRLTLWRAIGSSGGWLVPEQVARKRVACGV